MKDDTKLAQPMGEYVPGMRDDEKAALEAMAAAKADFERCRGEYDEMASKHKFFVDEVASYSDESRKVNSKIRAILREPFEGSHKELITLRAEMRESLEMVENCLFLADECSGPTAEAKTRAEKAAHKYRSARVVAIEIIADNMLDAAIDSANSLNLFVAMYARMKAFQEMTPPERTWQKLGFDSEESAVLSDVNTRIARVDRSVDEGYLVQMLPRPLNEPLDVGGLGEGTPATWHKARVASGENLETSAT